MKNVIRLFREMRRYWRVMALIGCLTLASAAVGIPGPLIVRYLIDHLIARQAVNLPLIFGLLVGIAALNGVIQYALTMAVTYIGQRFKYDIRRKLYGHMQTLSLGFFEMLLSVQKFATFSATAGMLPNADVWLFTRIRTLPRNCFTRRPLLPMLSHV